MILKLGKLILSRENPYMSTTDDVAERFPIKIDFTRRLTEQELSSLAVYALMIENGWTPNEEEAKRSLGLSKGD